MSRPAAELATDEAEAASSRRSIVRAAILSAVLVSLPFLSVDVPPITDLPQQAAQIRLASEALSGPSPYRLNLLAPGSLGYGLVTLSWWAAGPENAGRIAYLLLAWLWVAALALVVRRHRRPPELLPLATLFFFSHALYWGFSSFLLGAVVFLFWIDLDERLRSRSESWTEPVWLAVGGVLLYSSHALWCAAGLLWLATTTALAPLGGRRRAARAAASLPAVGLALAWLPSIERSGFQSETAWRTMPWERLAPVEWVDRALGGLRGPTEPVILGALAIWILLGLLENRSELRHQVAGEPLLLAGLMLAASLFLPYRFQNTLGFADRWTPVGMALLVLALPPPLIRRSIRWLVSMVLLATLAVTTTAAWKRFERFELDGLETSLAALTTAPDLLGLDFYRLSEEVKTQPFFQLPALAQLRHGGSLGFSFASFPSSPVVFRRWENPPWSPGLEWLPNQIFEHPEDFLYFDFALIHADPAGHAYFEQREMLQPVTESARWRLYRVLREGTSSVEVPQGVPEPADDS